MTDTPTNVYVGSGNTLYLAGSLNDAIDRAVREGEFDGLSGLYSVSGPMVTPTRPVVVAEIET